MSLKLVYVGFKLIEILISKGAKGNFLLASKAGMDKLLLDVASFAECCNG